MTMADASEAVAALLKPRSVALVGASADPRKTSGLPVHFLLKHGFKGAIYPINPRVSDIGGLPCYPDVQALPAPPDVGMVLVGADRAVQAVGDLAKAGAKAAIVLSSGFAESGEDGRRRQHALLDAAGSMRILGPNTIGLVNVTDGITLSASGALAMDGFRQGNVSVVSQSGGILGALLSRASARGLGLSKLISTSNEADLDVADFLAHLAGDRTTQVVALYLETIRSPEKFADAVRLMRRQGKHVVAMKVGRSEAGMRAAVSHTGAMAGSDQVYDAFFQRLGVTRAQTFSDLLDIPAALATQPPLRGRRIAVLTSTGGAGTLVADSLGAAGFEVPRPDEATQSELKAILPNADIAFDRNPIDVTLAGLQGEVLTRIIAALCRCPTYDGLAVVVGSSGVGQPDLIANAIAAAGPIRDKPVFAYVSPHAPQAASRLTELGIPAFSEPERVASAMHALLDAATTPLQREDHGTGSIDTLAGAKGSLDEAQAKALFSHFGISSVREVIVSTPGEAEAAARQFGAAVVIKILSGAITHKSEVGGVAVAVPLDLVANRLGQMQMDVATATGQSIDRFLVQEMVSGGVEIILGLRRDPLGSAILLGMGGITAELIKDTTLRFLSPGERLTEAEALAMIDELKTAPLLKGYRGRPKADVPALAMAIVQFSHLVQSLGPRLVEAEINPLFVLAEGLGVQAADGIAVIE
jgi:acyl-CoA synthetase (NDP forming)